MGSAVARTVTTQRDEPRSLNDVLLRFAEGLGADVAAVLVPVDGDRVREHTLSVEALLARTPSPRGKGVDHVRGWNRGPFALRWADRSALGRAMAARHTIVVESSQAANGDQPVTPLVVAAPVERSGIHLGVLYAHCVPVDSVDRQRLGWTADSFAQEMAPFLIGRSPA